MGVGPALEDGQLGVAAQTAEESERENAGVGMTPTTQPTRVRQLTEGQNQRTDEGTVLGNFLEPTQPPVTSVI